MIHRELILGILERAEGPLTMAEIEAQPEALAAKLAREDTQFVLRKLDEDGRLSMQPGDGGWLYQIKGKSFGLELGIAEDLMRSREVAKAEELAEVAR